jgi:hypothetical protein
MWHFMVFLMIAVFMIGIFAIIPRGMVYSRLEGGAVK